MSPFKESVSEKKFNKLLSLTPDLDQMLYVSMSDFPSHMTYSMLNLYIVLPAPQKIEVLGIFSRLPEL